MTDEEQRLRAALARDPGGPAFLALGEMLFARGEVEAATSVLEAGLAAASHGAHIQEARDLLTLVTRNHRGSTSLLEGLRAAPTAPDTMPSGLPSGMLPGSQPTPSVLSGMARPAPPATRPPPAPSMPPPVPPQPRSPAKPPVPRATMPPPRPVAPAVPAVLAAAPDTLPEALPHPFETSRKPAAKHVPMPTPQDIVGLAARPRVIGSEKPVDAATAALHYSASMGHEHLPALLRAGLLRVPGLPLPPSTLVQRRQRRKQRRWIARVAALGMIMALGVVGLVVMQTMEQRQREEAARKVRQDAEASLVAGSYDALAEAERKLAALVAKDDRVKNALALARVRAARDVLFGEAAPAMPTAILAAKDEAAAEGRAIAALAQSLRLGDGDAAAHDALAGTRDPFARWLRARYLATRDVGGAVAALDALAKEAPVAAIDHLALLLDIGKLQDPEAKLDALEAAAEARAPGQDQALLWAERGIWRAERGYEVAAAFDVLNVKLDRNLGPRVNNMRWYAQSYASLMLDDFAGAETALAKLAAPFEPRLRARIGLLQSLLGDIVSAREMFAEISAADRSVPASELRAAIALTRGQADAALTALGDAATVRAAILRAQAHLDLRDFAQAKQILEPMRAQAADSLEVEVYYQMASFLDAKAGDTSELERVSRRSKSKLGRHALALALVWKGRCDEADRQLRFATENISPEEPNPALYRSLAAFAEQRLCVGDAAGAKQYAGQVLELVDWYAPALAIAAAAKVELGEGKPSRDALLAFEATPEMLCGMCEVTLAKLIAPDASTALPADLDRASRALARAANKGATAAAQAARLTLGL